MGESDMEKTAEDLEKALEMKRDSAAFILFLIFHLKT